MLTIHATCGHKTVCCHCPDAECYQDCCAAFLGVLTAAAGLGAAAHYAPGVKAGPHDYRVGFRVVDDAGAEVFALKADAHHADASFCDALDAVFASCCAGEKVARFLKP